MAEAGALVGAIQVAASASTAQLPFFIAACDYTMIAEEFYAGAAALSKEPVIYGSVVAQDIGRVALTALIILGAIMNTFGSDAIIRLIKF